jgi:PAS domain S-box-containing protein
MATAEPPESNPDLFRRLVESVRDYAIFMLTPTGHIASWNSGAQLIKQYTAKEAIGQHFSIFYEEQAVQSGWPAEELRRAVRDGRLEDEGWRVRKDGTRFWANVVITALFGSGQLLGFAKVTRDLTERRNHEERLKSSERSMRLLIESVRDYAIFMLDAQGIITSWNPGAERIKGYSAQEAIGRPFTIFYTADAIARRWPEEELRRARRDGQFEDEGWRVRKDGSVIWANVVITAVRDETGELVGFSKVTRDLTERRRHEERLRESEERLRLIVDGVRDHAMFLLDAGGRIVSWNPAAEQVLGYTSSDAVGQDASILHPQQQRDAGLPQAEMRSADHAGVFKTEGWRTKADGTNVWVSATITALRDAEGRSKGFVHILRDLTEQRRIEELEVEGRRVLEFIAMLSHELRNPLAPIRTAVSILKLPQGQKEAVRYAYMIGRQVTHLTRLVDDLLDVSRITTGKITLDRSALELNTVVQLSVDSMRSTVEAHGHTWALNLAPQPIFIVGDAVRLTQVVVNLLSNAAKYTPPGGHIEISVARNHTVARVEISDNGVGMPQGLLQHAFDPFVQGSRTPGRPEGGLGIGLTLVKKIVELHGGSVMAASAGADRGSRFTVTLPLTDQAVNSIAAVPAPSSTRSGTILVVDDNRDAAEGLVELLRTFGHDVLIAFTGQEALDVAAAHAVSTVLLDIGLPDMSGYDVARRLRQVRGLEHVKIIATTGYGLQSDRDASADAGFDAHLVKPVDHEDIIRLIA